MRNGNMDFASPSRLVDVTVLDTDVVDVTEVLVFVCSKVLGRSPFVLTRLNLTSVADPALRVTVVTAPRPFTEDFTTASSFALSRTRSSIGIGWSGQYDMALVVLGNLLAWTRRKYLSSCFQPCLVG